MRLILPLSTLMPAVLRPHRRTIVEILHILAGLAVAVAMTWSAAWSYPLAWDEIWWCGTAAMVATVGMGIRPLRGAIMQDRSMRRGVAA